MTVTYCEWLGFGEPIEIELPIEEALCRFRNKTEALKCSPIIEALSFIGVKDGGKWIITNEEIS